MSHERLDSEQTNACSGYIYADYECQWYLNLGVMVELRSDGVSKAHVVLLLRQKGLSGDTVTNL